MPTSGWRCSGDRSRAFPWQGLASGFKGATTSSSCSDRFTQLTVFADSHQPSRSWGGTGQEHGGRLGGVGPTLVRRSHRHATGARRPRVASACLLAAQTRIAEGVGRCLSCGIRFGGGSETGHLRSAPWNRARWKCWFFRSCAMAGGVEEPAPLHHQISELPLRSSCSGPAIARTKSHTRESSPLEILKRMATTVRQRIWSPTP